MALGTILASAAAAAAPKLIDKFFGKKNQGGGGSIFGLGGGGAQQFAPAGFTGGGLNARFSGGNFLVSPDASRTGQVGGLALTFPEQAAKLAQLRAQMAPGYSALRSAQLGELENARSRAIGNLRENLSARRVLGSSFAQDALSRAEAEFGKERANIAANTFLQELEATHSLINEEFNVRRQQFTTTLDELNLEAEVGAKLAVNATAALQKSAEVKAELAAKAAEGAGAFYGKTLQPGIEALGKGIGSGIESLFSGNSAIGNWTTTVLPA